MSKKVNSDLDFGSVTKITNLPSASTSSEPATLGQLNTAIAAISVNIDGGNASSVYGGITALDGGHA